MILEISENKHSFGRNKRKTDFKILLFIFQKKEVAKFTFPFCSLPLIALTILNITAARVENTVSVSEH